jgi:pimeloyl-ACP methyl ester carboxylesterase
VAPDQRGYGRTDRPEAIEDYNILKLAGDIVGLVHALGEERAVVVGHDWGAPVAWNTALLRPDRVRGVVGMSVPFTPPVPDGGDTLSFLDGALGTPHHYQRWFQTDAAVVEADADPRRWLLTFYDALSGHHGRPTDLALGKGKGIIDGLSSYGDQPPWMTDADLEHLVAEFTRRGFAGGMQWYRTSARNQRLLRPFVGQVLSPPAAFLTGELDVVYRWPGMSMLVDLLPQLAPNLRASRVLPGVGHWTSEEAPEETNAFLLDFLAGL